MTAVLDGLAVVVLVGLPLWGLTGDRRTFGLHDPRAATAGAVAWLWMAWWCERAEWGGVTLALTLLMALKSALVALLYVSQPIGDTRGRNRHPTGPTGDPHP